MSEANRDEPIREASWMACGPLILFNIPAPPGELTELFDQGVPGISIVTWEGYLALQMPRWVFSYTQEGDETAYIARVVGRAWEVFCERQVVSSPEVPDPFTGNLRQFLATAPDLER